MELPLRRKEHIMIKADLLNTAGIDYAAGMERFGGDAGLYEMVLRAFLRDDVAERARAAYDANNLSELLKAVHEAKGSGGNAGFDNVYTAANEVVKLLRGNDYSDEELTARFLRFEKVYLSVQTAIKAALE